MKLIEDIKQSEGFKGEQYLDHLGKPTIGYGTLLPLTEEEAELLLRFRLDKKIKQIQEAKPILFKLNENRQNAIYEMCYQLGVGGVLKFKKMWEAIEVHNYKQAYKEALDSRWALQTPNRANKLANIIKNGI
jgi:lysozyme